MKLKDFLSSALFKEPQEITEDVVEYYRDNSDELDLIIDKDHFHLNFFGFFFSVGIGFTIFTRVLKFFFEDQLGDFINHVVLDVGSELGIAVFGGAVTSYFLEILQKRQYQDNLKFRREVKRRLREKCD